MSAESIALISIAITVLGALIVLVFKAGGIYNKVSHLDSCVPYINQDVEAIKTKLTAMEVKIDTIWQNRVATSNSPIYLNEKGKDYLNNSEIEKIISPKLDGIINDLKKKNPANAYQVQQILIELIKDIKNDPNILSDLQNAAFISGTDIDTLLFVAAIHFRDSILVKLGFNIADIDKHTPPKI